MENLDRINEEMRHLGFATAFKTAPERMAGTGAEALREMTAVIVDDDRLIIAAMLPHLVVNLKEIRPIHYKEQPLEEVAERILKSNPHIVLVDYNLGREVNGGMLARMLIDSGYEGTIIGLSSGNRARDSFVSAGVCIYFNKCECCGSGMIERIAAIMARCN